MLAATRRLTMVGSAPNLAAGQRLGSSQPMLRFMSNSKIQKAAASARLQLFKEEKANRSSLRPLKTKQKGIDILHDPLWNKGMAMQVNERDRLKLRGLLPPRVKTLEEQSKRAMAHLRALGDDNIRKNMYLQDLHNRNETLYHRVLVDHIEEVAPLVYTPTVGTVCQRFGDQFLRSRGMYFSKDDRGLFSSMVWNWPHDDVHVIVVTDGSRSNPARRQTLIYPMPALTVDPVVLQFLAWATSALMAWASQSASSPSTALPVASDHIGCCRSCSTSVPTMRTSSRMKTMWASVRGAWRAMWARGA